MPPPPSPPPASPQTLYKILTTHLLTTPNVLTLEILPSALTVPSPILSDPPNLALTKKALISCFQIAHATLFPAAPSLPLNLPKATNSEDSNIPSLDPLKPTNPNVLPHHPEALDAATAVLLLYNPEHLTAANLRKRHLVQLATRLSLPPSTTPTKAQNHSDSQAQKQTHHARRRALAKTLTQELNLLTSLLTSPLPRHAKSSTLWWHRYWLLRTFPPLLRHGGLTMEEGEGWGTEAGEEAKLGDERGKEGCWSWNWSWKNEIQVVLQAAERHGSNYYGFLYARRVLGLARRRVGTHAGKEREEEIRESVAQVQKWCLAHPRDISGWGFLGFLLWDLRGGWDGGDGEVEGAEETIRNTILVTERFVNQLNWKGESVAWFLKHMRREEHLVPLPTPTSMLTAETPKD